MCIMIEREGEPVQEEIKEDLLRCQCNLSNAENLGVGKNNIYKRRQKNMTKEYVSITLPAKFKITEFCLRKTTYWPISEPTADLIRSSFSKEIRSIYIYISQFGWAFSLSQQEATVKENRSASSFVQLYSTALERLNRVASGIEIPGGSASCTVAVSKSARLIPSLRGWRMDKSRNLTMGQERGNTTFRLPRKSRRLQLFPSRTARRKQEAEHVRSIVAKMRYSDHHILHDIDWCNRLLSGYTKATRM